MSKRVRMQNLKTGRESRETRMKRREEGRRANKENQGRDREKRVRRGEDPHAACRAARKHSPRPSPLRLQTHLKNH
jgi:hypothetical protein